MKALTALSYIDLIDELGDHARSGSRRAARHVLTEMASRKGMTRRQFVKWLRSKKD